jgi:AcrR family transcriptional regulator
MAARDTILDAAAKVMRERGLARATTKEIAREAGYSEALLYKHFADKQDIYLSVLKERAGAPAAAAQLVGSGTVRDNLTAIITQLMTFYTASFPMSASIFSDRELLDQWRSGMAERGSGPRGPLNQIVAYLRGESEIGRFRGDAESTAALLCGAAFQQAFLACFEGRDEVPDAAAIAARLVDELLRP